MFLNAKNNFDNLQTYGTDIQISYYGYDGGTTRTYKYSFDLNPNWVSL